MGRQINGRIGMPKLLRDLTKTAVLYTLIICACSRNQLPATSPASAKVQNQAAVHNDALDKYPIEKLTEMLKNRSNKTAYLSEPADLKDIPSSTLAQNGTKNVDSAGGGSNVTAPATKNVTGNAQSAPPKKNP